MACAERSTCTAQGARIRTLAYVVSECRNDPQGFFSGNQRLVIRRGNCDPVTVMELSLPAVQDQARGGNNPGICRGYGDSRVSYSALAATPFQRMGVLPDGSGVIFEVTNDLLVTPWAAPEPPEEGLYFVRADGSGLRRLGDALRYPTASLVSAPSIDLGFTVFVSNEIWFESDAEGRTLTFSDFLPGPDGEEATQIFTLDIRSGRRTQLTNLPASIVAGSSPRAWATCCPDFVDEDTIRFYTAAGPAGEGWYRIGTDGSGLERLPLPTVAPALGGRVVPAFQIAGDGPRDVLGAVLPGIPANPFPPFANDIVELFLVEGPRRLQLTNFGRVDTSWPALGGRRVFFRASANPFGTNPREIQQVFAETTLGGDLRQLTHFRDDGRRPAGCSGFCSSTCTIDLLVWDPRTRALVVGSSCDPFGRNPWGFQIFSMRPDGTGLRQLTDTRGMVVEPDGTVTVEMPGPFAYSAQFP